MNQNSPQISRIFSAGLHFCLWMFLIGFIGLNIIARLTNDPAWLHNLGALMRPFSSLEHVALAQNGWFNGNIERAKTELLIAESVKKMQPQVLGDTDPSNLLSKWEQEPEQISQEEQYWEKIIKEKPDYRDAFITASGLNYRLYRDIKAKEFLATAISIDPNNLYVRKLSELMNPQKLDK